MLLSAQDIITELCSALVASSYSSCRTTAKTPIRVPVVVTISDDEDEEEASDSAFEYYTKSRKRASLDSPIESNRSRKKEKLTSQKEYM